MVSADAPHGYYRYTYGCKCDVCRAAKAEYMRERRAKARALANQHTHGPGHEPITKENAFAHGAVRHVANIRSHGTRYGYEEAGCRCQECTEAHSAERTATYRRQRARRASPEEVS